MRSMTLVFHKRSRLRCCTGDKRGIDHDELGGLDLQRVARTPWPCRSRTAWPAPSGARAPIRRARPPCRSRAPARPPRPGGSQACVRRRYRARTATGPRRDRAGGALSHGWCDVAGQPAGCCCCSSAGRVVQPDRGRRHHRGHGMLVDQLDMTIAPQQQAEIVERADHALQLHAVDQEYGHRNLVLADVVEEHVLQVLLLLSCHFSCPTSFLALFRYPAWAPSGYRTQVHAPSEAVAHQPAYWHPRRRINNTVGKF